MVRLGQHIELLCPVVSQQALIDSLSLHSFDAGVASLLTEAVDPDGVGRFAAGDNVVLGPSLEVFTSQFHAALDLDFLHAAVLGLAFHVIRRHEKSREGVEMLD